MSARKSPRMTKRRAYIEGLSDTQLKNIARRNLRKGDSLSSAAIKAKLLASNRLSLAKLKAEANNTLVKHRKSSRGKAPARKTKSARKSTRKPKSPRKPKSAVRKSPRKSPKKARKSPKKMTKRDILNKYSTKQLRDMAASRCVRPRSKTGSEKDKLIKAFENKYTREQLMAMRA